VRGEPVQGTLTTGWSSPAISPVSPAPGSRLRPRSPGVPRKDPLHRTRAAGCGSPPGTWRTLLAQDGQSTCTWEMLDNRIVLALDRSQQSAMQPARTMRNIWPQNIRMEAVKKISV
jgi:hypothetical protein